jgi:hypothetical protein
MAENAARMSPRTLGMEGFICERLGDPSNEPVEVPFWDEETQEETQEEPQEGPLSVPAKLAAQHARGGAALFPNSNATPMSMASTDATLRKGGKSPSSGSPGHGSPGARKMKKMGTKSLAGKVADFEVTDAQKDFEFPQGRIVVRNNQNQELCKVPLQDIQGLKDAQGNLDPQAFNDYLSCFTGCQVTSVHYRVRTFDDEDSPKKGQRHRLVEFQGGRVQFVGGQQIYVGTDGGDVKEDNTCISPKSNSSWRRNKARDSDSPVSGGSRQSKKDKCSIM